MVLPFFRLVRHKAFEPLHFVVRRRHLREARCGQDTVDQPEGPDGIVVCDNDQRVRDEIRVTMDTVFKHVLDRDGVRRYRDIEAVEDSLELFFFRHGVLSFNMVKSKAHGGRRGLPVVLSAGVEPATS
jgi:hypothetical protein